MDVARGALLDYHIRKVELTGGQPRFSVGSRMPCVKSIRRTVDGSLPGLLPRTVFLAIAVALLVAPVPAQRQGGGGGQVGQGPADVNSPETLSPPSSFVILENAEKLPPSPGPVEFYDLTRAEACNSWTESGVHSPVVSVARLRIPGKATGEYQRACKELKDKRAAGAEDHARKAIQLYPDYAAAWVVLGQALDAQHKTEDARDACLQAEHVDSQYVAPYLCLAELAEREKNWPELTNISDRALGLDPVNNYYALYYSATAAFHANRLADAETKALDAVKLDTWNQLPQLHLLLARIYAAKGDAREEAAQLHRYLKIAPNAPESAEAKNLLAQVETPAPK